MQTMNRIFLLGLLICALRAVSCDSSTCNSSPEKKPAADATPPKHFNIILIGATGNLASKYLWHSLFEIFKQRFDKNAVRFQIYGCARKEANAGRKFMSDMLLNLIQCHDDACREIKTKFVEATQYLRLKTERDFKVCVFEVFGIQFVLLINTENKLRGI